MKQSDIWYINLDPTKGAEIKKIRPGVIVNDDTLGKLPLKVIVPLTDWKERYEIAAWMVKINPNRTNNLSQSSAADCFQIRSISKGRFVRKIGRVDSETFEKIKVGLSKVLSIID